MPVVQAGSLNTTALIVPDLYVQIVPPQNLLLNGVPTNVLGVVGTATWGPVGQPMIVSSMAQYASTFGPLQNRKYDMGTQVATAVQQGANNFRCVRVSDGTDAKATLAVVATCLTATALYTGSFGNNITVSVSAGSKASSWRIVVGAPGYTPEVFDNITGSGNAFWVNAAAAINNGTGILRGPSNFITAVAGVGTTAPSATSVTLAAGSDGTTTITAAVLVGSDTTPRTGMYALRGQGCSLGVLADADDSTQWTSIDGFGLSEGIYMVQVIPAGTSISAAVTAKSGAGLDSYSSKLMHGDWLYWNDPTNQIVRLVSPQGFAAGRLANLSPEQSSLNKPLYGVAGSQKSGLAASQNTTYAAAELQTLFQAGIEVICNPQPGGTYWGCRSGHNSSSNPTTNGDNYTRMTNYIASTLSAGMGVYVGRTVTTTLFQQIRGTLLNFLNNLLYAGQLGVTNGQLPFSVVCDSSNNAPSQTGLGYVTANVQVQYMAINEKFLVNLEGGQTVNVLRQQVAPNSQPATPVL